MRWLPSISFLSSSSSASSFRSSSCGVGSADSKQNKHTNGNLRGVGFGSRGKLTRQRRLRHLTDQDVSGLSGWSDSHLLVSPDGLKRCSVSDDHLHSASSSASAPPQPLPLPESSRRKENSGDFDCPLPSPKTGPSKGVEDRVDGIGDGVSANTQIRR